MVFSPLLLIDVADIPGIGSGAAAAGGLWEWAGLSVLALTLSTTLLCLIYLWGVLFRDSNLQAYFKTELMELFVTGVIFVLIYSLLGAFSVIKISTFLPASFLPSGPGFNPDASIWIALGNGLQMMLDDMGQWLNLSYVLNMALDQMASITTNIRPAGVGLSTQPLAGFASPLKQLAYNMTTGLSVSYIITAAQKYVYVFGLYAFLKYYLPIGLFLRCFTPTRRLGGSILGVCIAFLFFFPVLSMVTFSVLYSADGPIVSFKSTLGSYLNDQSNANFIYNMNGYYRSNFTTGILNLVWSGIGNIGNLLGGLIGSSFLFLLLVPISTVAFAFAAAFVLPTFNILVFTQAAKGLSSALGNEVDISSLTRLI
jgi:hypothetical protein